MWHIKMIKNFHLTGRKLFEEGQEWVKFLKRIEDINGDLLKPKTSFSMLIFSFMM